jgi:disulfide bond formation protein DsbB
MDDGTSRGAGAPSIARALLSRRSGNLIGFLACAGLLGFAYYLQYGRGLEPCPLCMIQRLFLAATGLVFLAAAIHHPGRVGAWIYGGLAMLLAAAGAAVAGRHVWLQHTPADKRPACGPGLDYLVSTFGPFDALQRILRGSGECGAVDWSFLGLSIPEWTLACFIALGIYAIVLAARD